MAQIQETLSGNGCRPMQHTSVQTGYISGAQQ